ncbi:hypothetical protein T492DRAFT_836501 [Pavlovales sp. CCMP2436]|nr:hypothetical protein T492DRAFT_836501 [Pavlovales sp. CCMP2436]
MDFELAMGQKRLEKEASKRKVAQEAVAERQRRERERVDVLRREQETVAAAEREAALEAAAKLRARHEVLLEKNKGVWASQALTPQLSTSAEAKGIRRRADKITLPRSFGESLRAQHDGSVHGPMYFELSVGARVTHAALLDFDSPEGVVGLPPKVINSYSRKRETPGVDAIMGDTAQVVAPVFMPQPRVAALPQVTVAYRALVAGTYAKLQPVHSSFQRDLGDIKTAMELELHTHATLSGEPESKPKLKL